MMATIVNRCRTFAPLILVFVVVTYAQHGISNVTISGVFGDKTNALAAVQPEANNQTTSGAFEEETTALVAVKPEANKETTSGVFEDRATALVAVKPETSDAITSQLVEGETTTFAAVKPGTSYATTFGEFGNDTVAFVTAQPENPYRKSLIMLSLFGSLSAVAGIWYLLARCQVLCSVCSRPAIMRNLLIGQLVLWWFGIGIGFAVLNKWILYIWRGGCPFPVFFTFWHMALKGIFAFIAIRFFRCKWPKKIGWKRFFVLAVPIGAATSLDVAFGNISLLTISLAFYTMIKSTSLLGVLMLGLLLRIEKFSWKLMVVIVTMCIGLFLATFGEPEFEIVGFLMVILSVLCGSLRWVVTEILLGRKALACCNTLMGETGPYERFDVVPAKIRAQSRFSESDAGDDDDVEVDIDAESEDDDDNDEVEVTLDFDNHDEDVEVTIDGDSDDNGGVEVTIDDDSDDNGGVEVTIDDNSDDDGDFEVTVDTDNKGFDDINKLIERSSEIISPRLEPRSQKLELTPLELVFYIAPASAFALVPVYFGMEYNEMISGKDKWFSDNWTIAMIAGFSVLGGILAFSMILIQVLLIKRTSSLGISVFGILKSIVQIAISVFILGEKVTLTNIIGTAVTAIALFMYAYVRHKNKKEEALADAKNAEVPEEESSSNEDNDEALDVNEMDDGLTVRTDHHSRTQHVEATPASACSPDTSPRRFKVSSESDSESPRPKDTTDTDDIGENYTYKTPNKKKRVRKRRNKKRSGGQKYQRVDT